MAVDPRPIQRSNFALRLDPFEPAQAGLIASWITSDEEAFQLAPRTDPPLTAEKLRTWGGVGHDPQLLMEVGNARPLGYGELNVLNAGRGEYWMGHLIVDPQRRGEGLGVALTRLLLHRAFTRYQARRVSLVVFPSNQRAISCYRTAGMYPDGFEMHVFPAYGRQERLLRMVALELE